MCCLYIIFERWKLHSSVQAFSCTFRSAVAFNQLKLRCKVTHYYIYIKYAVIGIGKPITANIY